MKEVDENHCTLKPKFNNDENNSSQFDRCNNSLPTNNSLKYFKHKILENQERKNKMGMKQVLEDSNIYNNNSSSVHNIQDINKINKSLFSKNHNIISNNLFQNYLFSKFNKLRPSVLLNKIEPLHVYSKNEVSSSLSFYDKSNTLTSALNNNKIKIKENNMNKTFKNFPISFSVTSLGQKNSCSDSIPSFSELKIKNSYNTNKATRKCNLKESSEDQDNVYSTKSPSDPFIKNYYSSLKVSDENHNQNLNESENFQEKNDLDELNVDNKSKGLYDSKRQKELKKNISSKLFLSQQYETLSHYKDLSITAKNGNKSNKKSHNIFNRFDKLYLDYKDKNLRNKIRQEQLMKSQGFIFSPKTNSSRDKVSTIVTNNNKKIERITSNRESDACMYSIKDSIEENKGKEKMKIAKSKNGESNVGNRLYSFFPLYEQDIDKKRIIKELNSKY